jgi:para-aminobenzoate synthetase / 4-amino-4-deoxychorismate lyase
VRLVDDEELVGPFEQIVGFARHRVFDDLDEIFGTHCIDMRVGAEQDRASATLIVRRARKCVERAVCVAFTESGFDELAKRVLANHRLRARTRRHTFGFDADDAPRPFFIGVRDADERIGFFAAFSAHRGPTLQSELRAQAYVGAHGTLRAHDFARDRFDQSFDARRFVVARENVERDLFENLGETRHMHAGFVGCEIGDHRKLAVIYPRASVDFQMHDAAHARDADAIERQPDLGLFFLTIGIETQASFALAHAAVSLCLGEMRRNFGERNDVVGARFEVRLNDASVEREHVDVDRARGQATRSAGAPHRELDVARKVLERGFIQLGAYGRGDIEIGRSFRPVSGGRLVERRNGNDFGSRPKALQRGKDIALPIAEIRAYSYVNIVHDSLLFSTRELGTALPQINSLRVIAGAQRALLFERPERVVRAWTPGDAEQALARAGEALTEGFWIAGYFAYELGTALLNGCSSGNGPLLALGFFSQPREFAVAQTEAASLSAPLPRVDRREYDAAVVALQRAIADGDVYQVNYTVPFDIASAGDPFALYAYFAHRTKAAYQAYVEDDTRLILSWSPELFLEFDGKRIVTRPMKGTAPLDDIAQLESAKNRAEHVMIVDLLRNDLHRICSHVGVEQLFTVERYPTFATMTSTIAGELRDDVSLLEILRATFPCGSITGAPKRAAMKFIAQYERHPRGAYCGSIGYLSPQRRGWWNVAIRTAQIDRETGAGRYDAGGGIVADSIASDEWNEIRIKSAFLRPPDGAFALLETFATTAGDATKRKHFHRLRRSINAFGLAHSIDEDELLAMTRDTKAKLVRLRLTLDGELRVATEPLDILPECVPVCLSTIRVRSDDPFLRHKTSWRPLQQAAAAQAQARGCFDALMRNERGELTEGTRTNLFFRMDGQLWTPPVECGLLPGILRERVVTEGARERAISFDDLRRAEAIYVGNSARGLLRAQLME